LQSMIKLDKFYYSLKSLNNNELKRLSKIKDPIINFK